MMALLLQSAGAGVGVFAETRPGLSMRKRTGRIEGMVAGSAARDAAAAGPLALGVIGAMKEMTGAGG